ncbi:MAG: nitroreductase [Hyphomicrobiaceae bacterium]|nr:nitroreductase [Hyphomicrobiaceae bacterium]
MNETLKLLAARRSAKAALLAEPGPSPAELETILTIAARVPDHKRLVPWRFIVFEGAARARFGEVLASVLAKEDAETPSHVRLETERQRFLRAPLVVAVVSRVVESKGAPEWEQVLSAGAAAFSLCLAANACGYGTCWITEWYAYSKGVQGALGLAQNERVAGFVYIGTEAEKQPDRERPVMAEVVSRWQG